MNNRLREALEPVRATQGLKENTVAYLRGELVHREHRTRGRSLGVALCCAALILVLCGLGSYRLYSVPVSFISVDVNPSVELGLNRLDRVVTVTAYNDEGVLALEGLQIRNKPYTEAIELLLAGTFSEYLTQDALLSFTVVSDREEVLLEGIRQCHGYAQSRAECHSADAGLAAGARESGISLGKYQAFLELSQYDPELTPEDCRNLSMRELRDRISDHTAGEGGAPQQGGEHHGNGHRKGNGNR